MRPVLAEVMSLFDLVIDAPEPEAEAARLCGDRPDVHEMLLKMIAADRRGRTRLTGVAEALLARHIADDDAPLPERLGGYRILGELGRGGMGRVLDAEQDQPRRRVALKIIRPSLASARTRAWLAAEAEALGMLLHPGIPQVYEAFDDAGVVGLVMERVDGVPLMTWAAPLGVRERAALVRRIVLIVQHAHERGLLHRDLKPGNVLVTADGQPKVLDFGLATLTSMDPEDRSRGPIIAGTPAYMAPEQRRGEPLDLRADVYGLGVLMGEVLRGDLPGGGLADGHPELSGDLDAIHRMATRRDPRRRYPTAQALADDLGRYLAVRPVRARGGGQVYAATRFAQRHRGLVLGSGLFALLMALATVFSSIMAVRATRAGARADRERGRADASRQRAVEARKLAEARRRIADEEARRARATTEFLADVFLRTHPTKGGGGRTLSDATRSAAERLDQGTLPPDEEAALRMALAEAMFGERDIPAAKRQLEQVVALYDQGRIGAGVSITDAWHGIAEVARVEGRADDGERALDTALAFARGLEEPRRRNEILHSRAWAWLTAGRVAEAEGLLTEALTSKRQEYARGRLPPFDLANTLSALARCLWLSGRLNEADALLVEADATLRGTIGESHLATANVAWYRTELALWCGAVDDAARHLDAVTSIRDGLSLPWDHYLRGVEPYLRATIVRRGGDAVAAADLAEAALSRRDAAGLPTRADDLLLVVECLVAAGRPATDLAERAVSSADSGPLRAAARCARGIARRAAGEDGSVDLAEARALFVTMYGPATPWTARSA